MAHLSYFDEVSLRCSRVQDEYIIISRVHCQTAAAGSVYTTILTVAMPTSDDTIMCVYSCLRAYVYRKYVACCICCDAAHPDDKSYASNNDTGESTVTDDPLSTM